MHSSNGRQFNLFLFWVSRSKQQNKLEAATTKSLNIPNIPNQFHNRENLPDKLIGTQTRNKRLLALKNERSKTQPHAKIAPTTPTTYHTWHLNLLKLNSRKGAVSNAPEGVIPSAFSLPSIRPREHFAVFTTWRSADCTEELFIFSKFGSVFLIQLETAGELLF